MSRHDPDTEGDYDDYKDNNPRCHMCNGLIISAVYRVDGNPHCRKCYEYLTYPWRRTISAKEELEKRVWWNKQHKLDKKEN